MIQCVEISPNGVERRGVSNRIRGLSQGRGPCPSRAIHESACRCALESSCGESEVPDFRTVSDLRAIIMASSADGTSRQRHRLAPRPPAAVYQEVAGVLQSQTTKINGLKTPGAQTSMDDEGACSTTQSLGCRRLSVAVRRCRGHARGQPRGHDSMAPFHKGPAPGLRPTDSVSKAATYLTTIIGRKASWCPALTATP